MGSQKSVRFGHKNEDISESASSFASGAIFLPSLGHDLSRNAFVASILFPERISYGSTFFSLTPKMLKSDQIFGKMLAAEL